ncbi:MAG: hypothetical protein HYV60_13700, partial [Planctomycetia bacterium]|nr:hypothetical protein [Planctomycetia bacterium]
IERSVRWCYRNPWPTAALGVLLLAVVGTTAGFYQARLAQKRAEVAQHQAEMSRDQLLAAINELFTAWGDVTLLNEPGFEEVRAQLLTTASNLYKQMGDQLGEDPKIQHELGVSYFRLGRMMFHLRSYATARESLEAGLKIQRDLHAALPQDEVRLHALGESLNLLGNILEVMEPSDSAAASATQQRLEQAEATYEEAIAARTELVDRFPDHPEYERQLLNSRMNRGMVRQRMGGLVADQEKFDEAQTFYEEARTRVGEVQVGLRNLLDRVDEESEVRRDVLQDLAQCSYNMANVTWWLGDLEATGEHVASAVAAFDTLLAAQSHHLENQYDQAHCLMLGGDVTSEQLRLLDPGQNAAKAKLYDEALAAYDRAKATLERLASKSTSVPKYRRAVAQVYVRIGDLQLVNQQDQQALAAYQSAADVLTPLVAEFPAYQQFLDEANSAIDQTKQYIKEAAAADEPSKAETR